MLTTTKEPDFEQMEYLFGEEEDEQIGTEENKLIESFDAKPDDENEPETFKDDDEPVPREDKTKQKIAPDKSADVAVMVLDMLTSIACARTSGRGRDNYKMTKDEKEEIKEPLSAWIEEMGGELSPMWGFIIALSIVSGSKVYMAAEHNKEDEKDRLFQARKAAIESQSRRKEVSEFEEEESQPEESVKTAPISFDESAGTIPTPSKYRTRRKQYQIDANGYFEMTDKGVYVEAEDRTEKPTAGELKLIESLMAEKATKGQINAALRKYNKINL